MEYARWVQILGAAAMLVSMAAGRIPRLRPYSRRIAMAVFAVYLIAAAAFVTWRLIVGPG